ncbi:alpha/beta hydrolase fold domain-containing protein [Frankia sp. AgB32]|uniref:alpha/beta hydrolase fold domain-containing protein n=1 Tax=Frankia sp. AgB32 TaxID=631119 RepID=UPI00200F3E33|nr:alpha/beta hydrolase fold domain-containing protein [Frankia sp. AgB32]MCK9897945.1 alpha/beta hydrolase [Frankia sp. AgB32]
MSTRHLVDPEVAPALDVFPPFSFSPETLPAIRASMNRVREGAPVAADVYPDTDRREVLVPGAAGTPDVRVLLYAPKGSHGAAPALLWMHGGGFVIGAADNDDLTCRRIVSATGAVVASVDYRLAPETPAPGPLDDCYAVLRWLHAEAESLGVDVGRIAVGGASAGGGLAACLAILARDRGEITIGFQLLIYPMLDDRTGTSRPAHPYAGEFVWTPADNHFGWSSLLPADLGRREWKQPSGGLPQDPPHDLLDLVLGDHRRVTALHRARQDATNQSRRRDVLIRRTGLDPIGVPAGRRLDGQAGSDSRSQAATMRLANAGRVDEANRPGGEQLHYRAAHRRPPRWHQPPLDKPAIPEHRQDLCPDSANMQSAVSSQQSAVSSQQSAVSSQQSAVSVTHITSPTRPHAHASLCRSTDRRRTSRSPASHPTDRHIPNYRRP